MGTCLSITKIGDSANDTANTSTYTVTYRVIWSDGTATSYDVRTAQVLGVGGAVIASIPSAWSPVPYAGLQLISRDVSRVDKSANTFTVTCRYETPTNTFEPRPQQPATIDETHPAIPWNKTFSVDGVLYEEPINKDYSTVDAAGLPTGTEIRLATGEPVDPPVTTEYWDREITLSYRLPTQGFIAATLDAVRGKINTETITFNVKGTSIVCAAKTLKCAKCLYALGTQEGQFHWQVDMVLHHRKDGWDKKVQSKSYMVKSGTTIKRQTEDHQATKTSPMPEPQFHTADGTDWVAPGGTLPAPKSFQNLGAVAFTAALTPILTIA